MCRAVLNALAGAGGADGDWHSPGGPGSRHTPPAPGKPEPEPVELTPPAVGVGDAAADGDGLGLGADVDLTGDGVGEGDGEPPWLPPERLCVGGCDCPEVFRDVEPGCARGSSALPPGGATAAAMGVPRPAGPLACGSCILMSTDTRRM